MLELSSRAFNEFLPRHLQLACPGNAALVTGVFSVQQH